MRFLALIVVLVAAASIAAASAQTQTGTMHDGNGKADLELTYTKWFAPGFPNMVGVVGGDIVGKFGGAVYEKTGPDSNGLVHLTAVYIVIAPDPAQSFTALVKGTEDLNTRPQHAVLDGRVLDGSLKHAHVHAEFDVIANCALASGATCFQGTISVSRSSDD